LGPVRTNVIAGNSGQAAFMVSRKNNTGAKTPMVLALSLPRKITPGETVTLPVTVFGRWKNQRVDKGSDF